MLFRAIKHQVDKGPVDAVTGKAKYTLNDNRLLREDVEYRTLVRTHTGIQCIDTATHVAVSVGGSSSSILLELVCVFKKCHTTYELYCVFSFLLKNLTFSQIVN